MSDLRFRSCYLLDCTDQLCSFFFTSHVMMQCCNTTCWALFPQLAMTSDFVMDMYLFGCSSVSQLQKMHNCMIWDLQAAWRKHS
jgi:hypothetical protein